MAPELKPGYHIDNVTTQLDSVMAQYADLLNPQEHALYAGFQALSTVGKSLYCRLLTRRGPWIRLDKLRYADIDDLDATLAELNDAGMAAINGQAPLEDWLNLLTKAELIHHFDLHAQRALTKPALLALILDQQGETSPEPALHRLQQHYPAAMAHHQDALNTYNVCFFGNSHQDLSEFVISDLGHVQYEPYPLNQDTRFFEDRPQIEQHLAYSTARQRLDDRALLQDADSLLILAHALPEPAPHPHLARRYQKVMLTIARQLERLDQLEAALPLYQRCQRHPSRERQARILKKLGQPEAALSLCQQIQADSTHPEEREFVGRFLPPLHKALGLAPPPRTQSTWPEQRMTLRPTGESVEHLAAAALTDDAHPCHYVENTLFNGLFGLLFWDIIFAPQRGAFINPFQRGPLDGSSDQFYPRRQAAIDARLAQLQTGHWQQTVWQHYQQKQGIANRFVAWGALSEPLLQRAMACIPANHLHHIFRRLLLHPGLYSSGFPDLIRFSDTGYELIEVKGPGDKLQPNQTRWLRSFLAAGIPASVLWVHWGKQQRDE